MKILFVCLGNICRSPLLETVWRERAARAGIDCLVASAGTGAWHRGAGADRRAITAAARRGYPLDAHRARQVQPADFESYDWLLAADMDNLRELERTRPPVATAKLALALEFAGIAGVREVADPYYGNDADFDRVVELAERIADAVLHRRPLGA